MSSGGNIQQKTGGFLACTTPLVPDTVDAIKTGLHIKDHKTKLSPEERKKLDQRMEVSTARVATASIGMTVGLMVGGPPGAILGAIIGRHFGASLANRHYKDFGKIDYIS